MKLRVLALAHAGPDWAEAACREYAKRLPRHWKTRVDLIAPARRSGKAEAAYWQAADSERARQALEPGAALVLLHAVARNAVRASAHVPGGKHEGGEGGRRDQVISARSCGVGRAAWRAAARGAPRL